MGFSFCVVVLFLLMITEHGDGVGSLFRNGGLERKKKNRCSN